MNSVSTDPASTADTLPMLGPEWLVSGCTFTEISRGLGKGFPVTDKARGLPTPVHRLKISNRICFAGYNVIIFHAQTVEL